MSVAYRNRSGEFAVLPFLLLLTIFFLGAIAPAQAANRMVGYYVEWAVYARNYEPADIPLKNLTHINFAFVNVAASGELQVADDYADFNMQFQAKNGFPAEKGLFNRLRSLKELYPGVKVLISLGGANSSSSFPTVAADASLRATFAASCAAWVSDQGLDGIDIDWEFPQASDKANFVALLQAVRDALDAKGQENGKEYLLTIAGPAGAGSMGGFDFPVVAALVDWINVMTYDYYGSWNTRTGFNAPLYEDSASPDTDKNMLNIVYTMNAYLNGGVPAGKLVLGMPLYGRSWENVPDTDNGLYQSGQAGPATGVNGNWEGGVFDYWRIVELLQGEYTSYWNDNAKVPWLYGPNITSGLGNGMFVSYDDRQSVGLKTDYLLSNSMGGAMFWELSGDVRDADASTSIVPYVAGKLGVKNNGPEVVSNLLWHKKSNGLTSCWDLNNNLQLEDTQTANGWKMLNQNCSLPDPWWYVAFVDLDGEGASVDGSVPATAYLVFWANPETRMLQVRRLQENYALVSEESGKGWEDVSASAYPSDYELRGVIRHQSSNILFWQNQNGQVVWWKLDNQGRLLNTEQGSGWGFVSDTTLAAHWTLLAPYVANGELSLLWRGNDGDSGKQIVAWKLDDALNLVSETEGEGWFRVADKVLPEGGWRFVDSGEFDGRSTLFWQNQESRKVVYWRLGDDGRLLDQTEGSGWGFLDRNLSIGRTYLAMGLLDAGEERALIWLDTSNGETLYWKLAGSGVLKNRDKNDGWGVIFEAESSGSSQAADASGTVSPASWKSEFQSWAETHFTPRLESEICLFCQPDD